MYFSKRIFYCPDQRLPLSSLPGSTEFSWERMLLSMTANCPAGTGSRSCKDFLTVSLQSGKLLVEKLYIWYSEVCIAFFCPLFWPLQSILSSTVNLRGIVNGEPCLWNYHISSCRMRIGIFALLNMKACNLASTTLNFYWSNASNSP